MHGLITTTGVTPAFVIPAHQMSIAQLAHRISYVMVRSTPLLASARARAAMLASDRARAAMPTSVSYLNMSRRLVRWMKQVHLPRTPLRMRYVRLVHAHHVLESSCSHVNLISAMQVLLAGWVHEQEGVEHSSYCQHLWGAIAHVKTLIAYHCVE